MNISGFLADLNPLGQMTESEYIGFWHLLFNTALEGFWGRFLATVFLALSFWFAVRVRDIRKSALCFIFALLFTFGAVFKPLFYMSGLMK